MILEQILVTSMAVFCYLIADEKSKIAALIDPAGDFDRIQSVIDKNALTLQWVFNTHGHFDHTSGNSHFIEKDAKLLIHEEDSGKLGRIYNKLLSRVIGGKGSPSPVEYIKDGDVLRLGDIPLKVIHTPGHSAGSVCIYTNGHVFTGDTLFTEGMGRTDFGDGSYSEIMNSITKKILTLPDDTIIWPGHHYGRSKRSTVAEQKNIYM